MPPAELPTVEGLVAQFERPLIVGIVLVYLFHIVCAAVSVPPGMARREQRRFLAAISVATFAVISIPFLALYGISIGLTGLRRMCPAPSS